MLRTMSHFSFITTPPLSTMLFGCKTKRAPKHCMGDLSSDYIKKAVRAGTQVHMALYIALLCSKPWSIARFKVTGGANAPGKLTVRLLSSCRLGFRSDYYGDRSAVCTLPAARCPTTYRPCRCTG